MKISYYLCFYKSTISKSMKNLFCLPKLCWTVFSKFWNSPLDHVKSKTVQFVQNCIFFYGIHSTVTSHFLSDWSQKYINIKVFPYFRLKKLCFVSHATKLIDLSKSLINDKLFLQTSKGKQKRGHEIQKYISNQPRSFNFIVVETIQSCCDCQSSWKMY